MVISWSEEISRSVDFEGSLHPRAKARSQPTGCVRGVRGVSHGREGIRIGPYGGLGLAGFKYSHKVARLASLEMCKCGILDEVAWIY